MSRTRTLLVAVAAVPFLAIAASSGAAAGETTNYSLEKTDTGYIRMNNRTGEMSICQEKSGQLICKLAADERRAYEEDVADLKTRVAKLEDTVASLGKIPPVVRDALPSDEEFEKGMNYMEKFMRRFMGIAKEFQNDNSGAKPPQAQPQKT